MSKKSPINTVDVISVEKKDFTSSKIIREPKTNKITKIIAGESSSLSLILKNTNVVFVNTLRRVALENIPNYAFCPKTIQIEVNDSIFNNDMLKLRLSQLPIFNLSSNIFYLDEKYWRDVNYTDLKRIRHPDDDKTCEININIHNDASTVLNVTTDHPNVVVTINDEKVNNVFNNSGPILLLQLKPDQKFICKMRTVLGMPAQDGEKNKGTDIWSSVSTCYYDENLDKQTIKLTLESQGQMSESEILIKCCKFIKYKLDLLKTDIKARYNTLKIKSSNVLFLEFENENHTFGNLLNYALQSHDDVEYSGLIKPDHLRNYVAIKLKIKKNELMQVIFEVIDGLVLLYNDFEHKIIKLKL